MNQEHLKNLLEQVARGELSTVEAEEKLISLPFEELAHSTIDLHRELRQGTPEVVYGESKTAQQIADNLQRIYQVHGKALATRVDEDKAAEVSKLLPEASAHPSSRLVSLGLPEALAKENRPYVAVVTAGTSDHAVSDEAAQTLQYLELPFVSITDVGVAGIHRLFPHLETLRQATAIIAIAGMEGALPSVIGGLVSCPVIAVPTSVGYGTARKGETALHAMLTSCASGIAVMNIDNGFGASLFAHTILSQVNLTTRS